MTLEQAMGIIARVQTALIVNGYDIGSWGPCGDGIDGRWGPDSREGWGAAMSNAGLTPTQTTELLRRLGVTEFDGMTFQTAVTAWNQWRSQQDVGSEAYDAAANAALEAATGLNPSTCPGAMTTTEPPAAEQPPADLYHAEPKKSGLPWWGWLIIGLGVAGAAGGGIWWYTQYYKKRKRRKTSGMNGYGKDEEVSGGDEILEEDFGEPQQFTYGVDNEDLDELDDDDEYT